MTLIPFADLPDHAHLWVFPASRRLSREELEELGGATDQFLAQWTAHSVPLSTGREIRDDQFVLVAVDESAAGASGCSIDALVRFIRDQEKPLGVVFTDNAPVYYREAGGGVRRVSRAEFQELVKRGTVGPDTVVFDNTVQTVGALRAGKWERPAAQSWHGALLKTALSSPASVPGPG